MEPWSFGKVGSIVSQSCSSLDAVRRSTGHVLPLQISISALYVVTPSIHRLFCLYSVIVALNSSAGQK